MDDVSRPSWPVSVLPVVAVGSGQPVATSAKAADINETVRADRERIIGFTSPSNLHAAARGASPLAP
jgi:hypothetical protein